MKLTVSDGFITMLPLDVRVGGAYFSFVSFNLKNQVFALPP
jgi:Tfp pilus assembly protein PilO